MYKSILQFNENGIKSIEHAVDSSYRISGENATNTNDIVSKQAVMKDIHKPEIPNIMPEIKVKKKLKTLYIIADEDYIEKIYIMGDGAPWIKTGLEVLGAKSIFVLDKFHLKQSIVRATAHLGDSVLDELNEVFDIIAAMDVTTAKKRIKSERDIRVSYGSFTWLYDELTTKRSARVERSGDHV